MTDDHTLDETQVHELLHAALMALAGAKGANPFCDDILHTARAALEALQRSAIARADKLPSPHLPAIVDLHISMPDAVARDLLILARRQRQSIDATCTELLTLALTAIKEAESDDGEEDSEKD